MPRLDRIPGMPTRIRRALDGIGSDFVPYIGAIKDVDLGSFNLTTTGTVTGEQITSTDDITMQGHLLTLGDGTATDIVVSFSASANDGIITFDESDNEFDFGSSLITTTALGTFGKIIIFDVIPILVFRDSTYVGNASLGYIEWRDSNNTRLGFFGNSSSGNDDLYWRNESTGGHIKIETTGAGEFQILANTVLNGNLSTVGTIGCGTITLTANSDILLSGTGHVTSGSEGFIVGSTVLTENALTDGFYTLTMGGLPWELDNHFKATAFKSDTYWDATGTYALDASGDPWSLNVSLTVIGTLTAGAIISGSTVTATTFNATDETDTFQIDGATFLVAPVASCIALGTGTMGNVGVNSVVIGTDAASQILASDQLVAIGFEAAKGLNADVATADDCVFIGHRSGERINGACTGNTCVGYLTGRALTTGTYNNCFGRRAGLSLTEGLSNTLIGESAGILMTTGQHNMVLGHTAGNNILTGIYNVCIGSNSGDVLEDGNYNTIMGSRSLVATGGESISASIGIGADVELTADHQCIIGGDRFNIGNNITDVYFGTGVVHASAATRDVTIHVSGGSGTDIGGADLILAGGKGTGDATPGAILFQTSVTGASGTTLQTLATQATIDGTGLTVVGQLTVPLIETAGTTDTLSLQPDATGNGTDSIKLFENAGAGDNPQLIIHGYHTGVGQKTAEIYINASGALRFSGTYGSVTFTGDLKLSDNKALLLGNNPDFGIEYDSGNDWLQIHSRLRDGGAADVLRITPNGDYDFLAGDLTTTGTITGGGAKCQMTPIGGYAIKLTNETGANTIAGQLVKADIATNDAVILAAAGDVECIGVFLDSGIADAAEAWVVVAGIADVAFDDNVGATRGDWVSTGVGAGYAATAASPAAAPTHFEEIGHCIETVAAGGGGTHINARCVLHFN